MGKILMQSQQKKLLVLLNQECILKLSKKLLIGFLFLWKETDYIYW